MNFLTEKARTDEFIEAGIHENVLLEPVRIGRTNSGKQLVELNLTFENGYTLTLTEFSPIPFEGQTQDEADEKAFKRLVSIHDTYPELRTKSMDATSFEEAQIKFVDNMTSEPRRAKTYLRVVLVNGNTGYLRLPNGINKGKNKFMELMSGTEIAQTNHKFGEKKDRNSVTPTVEAANKITTNLDDLPF